MSSATGFAAVAADRWLLAFAAAGTLVIGIGLLAHRATQRINWRADRPHDDRPARIRGRAGALVALGPLAGLAIAPAPGKLIALGALGAAGLAAVAWAADGTARADRVTLGATAVAAALAVAFGVRFGPLGVAALDVLGAFALIVVVTLVFDGLGDTDGLAGGLGVVVALGIFAPAAFGHQDDIAAVVAGLGGGCLGFLAFNLPPASLLIGRAGRLAIGYAIAVGALALEPAVTTVPDGWRDAAVPLILLGIMLLDATIVGVDRLRHRHPLGPRRSDHLVDLLTARGWNGAGIVGFLVPAQLLLGVDALFTARAVLPVWAGVVAACAVLLVVASRTLGGLEREAPPGVTRRTRAVLVVLAVSLVAAVAPLGFSAMRTVDLMQQGRDAARRGLTAARNGDPRTALAAFNEAATRFAQAHDELSSPIRAGAYAVPVLASNARAAKALAEIGAELAHSGETVSQAMNPDALAVVDGRLPLEEIRKIRPTLHESARVLHRALARIDELRGQPFLLGNVRDAINTIRSQLARADREATRATAAADLAPAIFGGEGTRTYLLVVQNNAEARATGGIVGSYAILTAQGGKIHVGPIMRDDVWDSAVRALPNPLLSAPPDYLARYTQFGPTTTLQNVNLSPDFPSVAQALMSLAPQVGLPQVDGVVSVDPLGLAALLELTGPVTVTSWPTPIDSENVVNITLRDAYAAYEATPERADFLGDVAEAAVDKATTGRLGKPAQVAKVLGAAAHHGHFILAFSRSAEQRLAEQLGVAGEMAPIHSDAIAVTTSNASGTKLDYYLDRTVEYHVSLRPNPDATSADARGELRVKLANDAPDTGLPHEVLGPFDARFVAGENRTYLSLYSPLSFTSAEVEGKPAGWSPSVERGRNVYSRFADLAAKSSETMTTQLIGQVELNHGWYSLELRHQPTLNPDLVRVSVEVPRGWRIDHVSRMRQVSWRRASTSLALGLSTILRVHVVREIGTWSLWERLKAGR